MPEQPSAAALALAEILVNQGSVSVPRLALALDQFREAERQRCAKIADLYADINIQAGGDTCLANGRIMTRFMSGEDRSPEAVAKWEELAAEGVIHSSAYHTAKNIAERIRSGEETHDDPK